jgi:hypothetical protein
VFSGCGFPERIAAAAPVARNHCCFPALAD